MRSRLIASISAFVGSMPHFCRPTRLSGHARGLQCLSICHQNPVFLANEVEPEELHLLSNEFAPGSDGWVRLSKYGNFPHAQGLQRFFKADAVNLVNEFNGLLRTPQRLLGLPWYIGHPDHPQFKTRYTDTKAYGRIKGLEAREDGLFANVKWSPAGEELIRSEAFHGHSMNWGCKLINGAYVPVRLKSVGFTNEPNIDVDPITLANEEENLMKKQLIEKLGLPADATDEQVLAAVDLANEAKSRADQADADKVAAEAAKSTAETALANEVSARSELEIKASSVIKDFANERKARIELILDGAIRDGKITAADRERWQGELTASFDAKVVELANAKPVIKTEARTKHLGQRKESSAASDKVVELVNERMSKTNEEWTVAWAVVKRENPALFVQMQETAKAE